MLLHFPDVLSVSDAAAARGALERADWIDGRVTAGYQSAQTKRNLQLPEEHPLARELGTKVIEALGAKSSVYGRRSAVTSFPAPLQPL